MSFALSQLRQRLRHQRRQVTIFQQRRAEQQLLQQLRTDAQFRSAKHIGLYLNAFGEIHTRKLILQCFAHAKIVYLPLICPMNQKLVWVRVSQSQYLNHRFAKHRLGMQQPMATRGYATEHLDLLFMPLLGCDHRGMRLGMGGGFYDRTLACAPKKPYRIGLAHDFQRIEQLTTQPWDQGLDALITPSQLLKFKRQSRWLLR